MSATYEDVTEEEKEETPPYAELLVASENKGVALRIRIQENIKKLGDNTNERTKLEE